MLPRLIRYFKGYLRIRVKGTYAERFLNACGHKNIFLWDIKPSGGSYEMNISIRGFRKLKPIIRKTGTKAVIVKRFGLPFFLQKYRRRKVFFAGALLCLCLIWLFSGFLWNIEIRGNLTYTDEELLEFLQSTDVRNGMPVRDIDCGQIVKDIRRQYNNIIWVSASIEGTRLLVQVKENETATSQEEERPEPETAMDLVSGQDCVITSMIVRQGVPQVEEGAAVKKGEILVSGQVPVINDAKEVIGFQYHVSDADIIGQVELPYEDEMPLTYQEKKELGIEKAQYFLRLGSLRVSLGSFSHSYEHFHGDSVQWQGRLFGNFYLPVSWGARTIRPYEESEKAYSAQEIRENLTARFSGYCEDLGKKGVEIIENDVKIYTGSHTAQAKGTLTVLMPIGEEAPSKLIELPQNEQSGEEADGNDGSSN